MELEIKLLGCKPEIKRVIQLNPQMSFHDFHYVIQIAMGWENMHLYQFSPGARTYIGDIKLLDYKNVKDSRKVRVDEYLNKKGDRIQYEYDFGDGWLHEI